MLAMACGFLVSIGHNQQNLLPVAAETFCLTLYICITGTGKKLHYVGCFRDTKDRDLPERSDYRTNNSPQQCVDRCTLLLYHYAGLQVIIIVIVIIIIIIIIVISSTRTATTTATV